MLVTKRIYRCQKENSVQGDWCELIVKDFQKIGMVMSEAQIEHLAVQDYKDIIKKKVRIAAFDELNTLKQGHKKVEYNQYSDILKPQSYITDKEITNTQCKLLFALRSHTVRGIRYNFRQLHSQDLLCPICERFGDTQDHVLDCQVLQNILPKEPHIEYMHIYGNIKQQTDVIQAYEAYLCLRDEILENSDGNSCLPGHYSGPKLPQARTVRTPARSSI